MTNQNDMDDTPKRQSQNEQARSGEWINDVTAVESDSDNSTRSKLPDGWMDLDDLIKSFSPEVQADIEARIKRLTQLYS